MEESFDKAMNTIKYQPLVSILINNYNYGQFIGCAIESAVAQTYPNLEIIVVDDGSTDDSQAIIGSYQDRIIPIFKSNNGQASAFNAGFAASTGEIICFLDSDDYFELNKVEEVVKIFELYQNIGWCFHPLQYINNDASFLEIYPPPPKNADREIDFKQQICKFGRIPQWGVPTSGLSFSRLILEKLFPLPENIRIGSDNYLRYLPISESTGYFLNKPLSSLRIHGNNAWSLQKKPSAKKAESFLYTAYFLRLKSVKLRKLADKHCGWGLSLVWLGLKISDESRNLLHEYLSSISLREKINIFLRSLYFYFKSKFSALKLT